MENVNVNEAVSKVKALEKRGTPEGYKEVDAEYFDVRGTGYTDMAAGIPTSISGRYPDVLAKIGDKFVELGSSLHTDAKGLNSEDVPKNVLNIKDGETIEASYQGGDYFKSLDEGNILVLFVNGDINATMFFEKS